MTRRYHNAAAAPFYTRYTNAVQRDMTQPKPVAEADNEFDQMVPPADPPAEANGVGPAHLTTAQRALQFITGGNATFTLRSKATGVRYTYKVRVSKPNAQYSATVYFVSLLSGPENNSDYTYLGMLGNGRQRDGFLHFTLTRASKMRMESVPVKAIAWTVERLIRNDLPAQLEIWHAGRCGRCGRTLTVPESIASGFGPECVGKLGL